MNPAPAEFEQGRPRPVADATAEGSANRAELEWLPAWRRSADAAAGLMRFPGLAVRGYGRETLLVAASRRDVPRLPDQTL